MRKQQDALKRQIALLVIVALSGFLRLWGLADLPPGLYHDEAYNGLDALSLLEGRRFPQFYEGWELYASDAHADAPSVPTRFPIFFEGNYGREPLHIYLMALSIRVLGATPFAIRLVPALFGVWAVWLTYRVTKTIFNQKQESWLPLWAAFFVAIFVPTIHFSRFGLRVMLFLPFSALAVIAYWQGREGIGWRQWGWWGIAGMWVGVAFYTYASARLFPLVFMLFTVVWLIKHPTQWQMALGALLIMGMSALITALPLLLFFVEYPYYFIFRMSYVANKGKGTVAGKTWLTWLLNMGRVIGGLYWQGETHLRHNLPARPFLDAIQASFFSLGMWQSIKKQGESSWFVWGWFGVMLLPSIMSGDAPHFGRLAGVAIPLALLGAWGVQWVWQQIDTALWRGGLVFLLGLSCLWSIHDYFQVYAQHPRLEADFYVPDWEVGRWAKQMMPANSTFYLSPNQAEMATIYFALGDEREQLRSFAGGGDLLPLGIAGNPSLYVVHPDEIDTLHHLLQQFPQGYTLIGQPNYFIPFVVPPFAPPLAEIGTPLKIDLAQQVRLVGYDMKQTVDNVQVMLYWQSLQSELPAITAFVHLLDDAGNLRSQHDHPPTGYPTTDWRTGEFIVDSFNIPMSNLGGGTYYLTTGFYQSQTGVRLTESIVLTTVTIPSVIESPD